MTTASWAADSRWGLNWNAPDGCITAAELAAKAESRLGRSVFGTRPDYRIDGVMERGSDPKWKARLTVVSAQGEVMGSREVSGNESDCRALDGRLAFMIAVSIDPNAGPPSSEVVAPPRVPRAAKRFATPELGRCGSKWSRPTPMRPWYYALIAVLASRIQ